jgi:3-dehydroquinate dehydratase
MKFINLQNLRPMRVVVAIVACVVLFLVATGPAFAMKGTQSQPSEGEAQLKGIYKESEDALRNPPLSLDRIQSKANEGHVNDVQGAADIEKMKRPGNSQQATSVEEDIEKALDKATK